MVFSSIPSLYLDPPNWQQHPNQHQLVLLGQNSQQQLQHDQNQHHHHLIPQPQQIPQSQPLQPYQHSIDSGPGSGSGSGPRTVQAHQIRPNSIAEQARQLRIPPPELQRKCPRCESTNTKFCYYNNYNLLQPRHFCKTCRRYWTHGGALRNVPVGGGCRRNNKKTNSINNKPSSSNSRSLVARTDQIGSQSGHGYVPYSMASLGNNIGNMGLTFSSGPNTVPNPPAVLGGNTAGGLVRDVSGRGIDDFLLQRASHHINHQQLQFPNFLAGFEISGSSISAGAGGGGGIYSSSFQNDTGGSIEDEDNVVNDEEHQHVNIAKSIESNKSQVIKMEDNKGQMMIMGISNNNTTNSSNNNVDDDHQLNWNGVRHPNSGMWTNLSGLNSSSSGRHLV